MVPGFLTPIQTPRRVWAARILALVVDSIQLGAFPIFSPGALSPANDILDAVAAVSMVALLGWHWAFLPTFVAELVPAFDLVPTWTAAVLIVTRGAGLPGGGNPVDPAALPPAAPTKALGEPADAERPSDR